MPESGNVFDGTEVDPVVPDPAGGVTGGVTAGGVTAAGSGKVISPPLTIRFALFTEGFPLFKDSKVLTSVLFAAAIFESVSPPTILYVDVAIIVSVMSSRS
jgi:hypothetical protein